MHSFLIELKVLLLTCHFFAYAVRDYSRHPHIGGENQRRPTGRLQRKSYSVCMASAVRDFGAFVVFKMHANTEEKCYKVMKRRSSVWEFFKTSENQLLR